MYSVQSFLRDKTSANTVKLVRIVYFELLLLIVLYFLLKPIFVESVSSISVYLCQDWEFLLNYNFPKL